MAIVTGPLVDFFVGPTNDALRKVSYDEGRVVELNNQAKHAVTNGMADMWRIHLIFVSRSLTSVSEPFSSLIRALRAPIVHPYPYFTYRTTSTPTPSIDTCFNPGKNSTKRGNNCST